MTQDERIESKKLMDTLPIDIVSYYRSDLFESYEDAIEECISRNGNRNLSRLLDVEGKEILYQEVLASIAR